ncbi:MAG TPA: hypothetical protein VF801_10145 [Rhodocyclaceae bacterium]
MPRTFAVSLACCAAAAAHAGPADYVFTPHVVQGERELELKYGTARGADGSRSSAESLGLGYAVTGNWFTELYANRESAAGASARAHEWENKFMLTEPGEYDVDLGMVAELEVPQRNGDPYESTLGLLLQKDVDRMQFNLNGLLVRQFHDGQPHRTEHVYQWQAKYRWRPALEFGAQGFGRVERWPLRSEAGGHDAAMGPALFGMLHADGRSVLKYNAALLFGATDTAARRTFRTQIEYEF